MAVFRVSEKSADYFGYEGDVKPTELNGKPFPNGTTFMEIDKGAMFIFFNGAWEPDLSLIYAFSEALKQQ